MKKILLIVATLLIGGSIRADITPEAFSNMTLPFAEPIILSGSMYPDSQATPHFLYALNPSDLYCSVSFLDASAYEVAPYQGALLFVQPDGSHQVMPGSPFELETGLPPPRE